MFKEKEALCRKRITTYKVYEKAPIGIYQRKLIAFYRVYDIHVPPPFIFILVTSKLSFRIFLGT